MKPRTWILWIFLLVLISSGCTGAGAAPTAAPQPTQIPSTQPTPLPPVQPTALPSPQPTVLPSLQPTTPQVSGAYPECAFRADAPQTPAGEPLPKPTPTALPTLPANQRVDAATTAVQMKMFNQVWSDVRDNYAYPDFNGHDWQAIRTKYEALVSKGLTNPDFYAAMHSMVSELGDPMTFFITPADKTKPTPTPLPPDVAGIGGFGYNFGDGFAIIGIYPDGPAQKSGIKAHDLVLKVDGGPAIDPSGAVRTLGQAGSRGTLTVKSPGQPARDVVLTRERVQSSPIVSCLFSTQHIGYIHMLNWNDNSMAQETAAAIANMSKTAPLKGLILDNRPAVAPYKDKSMLPFLGLFTTGKIGDFTIHGAVEPKINTTIAPVQDVNGSQTIPLVVLISYQERSIGPDLVTGVLQNTRHAWVVGAPKSGIVEPSTFANIDGGGQVVIHNLIFQPAGHDVGAWDKKGKIKPDVVVNGDWLDFTEENDPYVAAALELLVRK